jgi:uncharacterized protein (DUF58 family)
MITPRLPLIIIAAAMVPFVGFFWMNPQTAWITPLLIALLVGIAGWDALRMRGVLSGIRLTPPKQLRLSKGRTASLDFTLEDPTQKVKQLHIGIVFPGEAFICELLSLQIALGEEPQILTWHILPIKRGAYQLQYAHLETPSPLGLWNLRDRVPCNLELRVHLEPMRERKVLAAIFLNRQGLGIHMQRQVGQGREFEKLRDFLPGDSLTDVHWRATAKRSLPVTREYRIERTQEIYIAIDASRLSARPAEPLDPKPPLAPGERITLLERYLSSAMVVGAAVEKQSDLFGMLTYHNQVAGFIRAASGQAHYQACRNMIYHLEPQPVTPDIQTLFAYVREHLRRRSLLFILTQLDDPVVAERFLQAIELISRRHLVVVGMMIDQDTHPMFANPNVQEPEQLYDELAAHLRWHKLRELGKVLKRRGVEFLQLDREDMTLQLVTTYMNIKQRQLL